MKKHYIALGLFIACIASYQITVAYVDNQLALRQSALSLDYCDKAWSTRGLVTDSSIRLQQANSIEAINLAIDNGARGVEVDVYFDVEMGQYVVSHDKPYNLKNGELLSLEKLFAQLQKPIYMWLDFKKLTRLNTKEVAQAVARLTAITVNTAMANKVVIETEHPVKLAAFSDAGFMTMLDTQPLPESYIGTAFVHNFYKLVYYFFDFTVMGTNFGKLDDPVYNSVSEDVLRDVPMFIYHVPNDKALITRLARMGNVQVVLNTDETANAFVLPGC
ncbi:hypothetical protein NLG07_03975 [Alteromonas sp. LMIT006]|uniref:hypothetical protein n=1 Tax=Alteromonadaceae TaxID=72275 RepID=UPI0020CA586D|nr:hypothetical protein [Alteromonas sp. LMIT006]UTP73406.1 hypothetical protein NLG07_03975 [Alteromonas sp. LMIT006]